MWKFAQIETLKAKLRDIHKEADYILQDEFVQKDRTRSYKALYTELYNLVLKIHRMAGENKE